MSSSKSPEDLHQDLDPVDEYSMDIKPDIVDKLGIKLYDKVSDAIAELIANAYDADAENVTVRLPLGKYLATRLGVLIASNISTEKNSYPPGACLRYD